MKKRTKLFPAIGLILISSEFLIGNFVKASDMSDFFRGLLTGIGLVLILFPFIKRKPRPTI